MKLVRTYPISTVEYGSTFQGLANKDSDKDLCTIVVRPLEDSLLSSANDGTVHDKDDNRYYSVEKFIQLILKGSNDSVTLLLAHMNNGHEPIQRLLKTLYIPDAFDSYMRSIGRSYLMSLVGELKKSFKKNGTEDLTCKQLLREVVNENRIRYYFDIITDYQKSFDYKTFMKTGTFWSDYDTKDFLNALIENKSQKVFDVNWEDYGFDSIKVKKLLIENRQNNTDSIVNNIKALEENNIIKPFKYEYDLKDDMVKFLINEYKGAK